MTPRQVLSFVESNLGDLSGLTSADGSFWGASIYSSFLASRATDILEELRRDDSTIKKSTQQTIGCLAMEEAPVEECPCAPPSGCTWFKSKLPLPQYIGDLLSVTAIGGNLKELEHFTYRDWTSVKFSLQSRIKAERERGYYAIRNNYLYIITKGVKVVSVSGLFYDPPEVQRFPNCGETTDYCSPFLDFSLCIDPAKYQKLLAMTAQFVQGMRGQAPLDTTNNAQPPRGQEGIREY